MFRTDDFATIDPGMRRKMWLELMEVEGGEATDGNNFFYYIDRYDVAIRYVDEKISDIFARLRQLGKFDRTAILVTSDHGESFFEHGFVYSGRTLNGEAVDILLIIKPAGTEKKKRIDLYKKVGTIDMSPAMLALAGCPPVPGMDGVDISRGAGRRMAADRILFSEELSPIRKGPPKVAALKGDYKAILHPWDPIGARLYDTTRDRGETRDLSLPPDGRAWAAPMEPLKNGSLIFGRNNVVFEYDMLGAEAHRWVLPDNYELHHHIMEKPNGDFLLAATDRNLTTVQDIALEMERKSGDILGIWDMRFVLDVDRQNQYEFEKDWFHMNSIWYDPRDDSLLISEKHQGIVNVTWKNESLWILSPHKGRGKAGRNGEGGETSGYLLTAVDKSNKPYSRDIQLGVSAAEDFDWPWGQHAPPALPWGNQVVFEANLYCMDYFTPEGFEGGTGHDIAYRSERVAVRMAELRSNPVSGFRQPGLKT